MQLRLRYFCCLLISSQKVEKFVALLQMHANPWISEVSGAGWGILLCKDFAKSLKKQSKELLLQCLIINFPAQVPHHFSYQLPVKYLIICHFLSSAVISSYCCLLPFLFCHCLILLNIVLLIISIKLVTSTLCTLYFLDQGFRYSAAYQYCG